MLKVEIKIYVETTFRIIEGYGNVSPAPTIIFINAASREIYK